MEPLAKFKSRVDEVRDGDLPPFRAASAFMSKFVSTLLYEGQVVFPPGRFKALELGAATKVFGFATSALTADAAFCMGRIGGIRLTRPLFALCASMIRAALKTFEGYEEMYEKLIDLGELNTYLRDLGIASTCPPGWDSEAFCWCLHKSVRGEYPGLDPLSVHALLGVVSDFSGETQETRSAGKDLQSYC